jgi:hypothetical protein
MARSVVLEEVSALLSRTPAVLNALLRGLPDEWITAHEGPDTWSAFDVVGHLIHGERTDWLPRLTAVRADNVRELAALHLTAADLERRGLHPDLGPVTIRQLLATWVAHDLDHLSQISRVLAHQYGNEVGPWRAYLRIIGATPG